MKSLLLAGIVAASPVSALALSARTCHLPAVTADARTGAAPDDCARGTMVAADTAKPAGAPQPDVVDGASPSGSQKKTWAQKKCEIYRTYWAELLAKRGKQGLGEAFLARNEAFIASGCSIRGDACPRSPQELDAANTLTILTMNAGMASTFVPFSCSRQADPAIR